MVLNRVIQLGDFELITGGRLNVMIYTGEVLTSSIFIELILCVASDSMNDVHIRVTAVKNKDMLYSMTYTSDFTKPIKLKYVIVTINKIIGGVRKTVKLEDSNIVEFSLLNPLELRKGGI